MGVEVVPRPQVTRETRAIDVHLTDRETGVTRTVRDTGEWEDGVFQDYLWSEGNCGCDCNRLILMYGRDDGQPCTDGRVQLRITDAVTGAEIYSEG